MKLRIAAILAVLSVCAGCASGPATLDATLDSAGNVIGVGGTILSTLGNVFTDISGAILKDGKTVVETPISVVIADPVK